MKKIIFFLGVYITLPLNGAVGCMDDSQHLKQRFDTKALHYVKCDCPCRSVAPGTHRCRKCGHIMVPQEQVYMTQADAHTAHKSKVTELLRNPNAKLKDLIRKYRKTK